MDFSISRPELPTELELQELHNIVDEILADSASADPSKHFTRLIEACKELSGSGPRNLRQSESELFAKLYRAIYIDLYQDHDAATKAHLSMVRHIAKALRLETNDSILSQSLMISTVSAEWWQSIPREFCLEEIGKIVEDNKHLGSYGVILRLGISPNTKVHCCIFGSKEPKEFRGPPRIFGKGISLPVLIVKDWTRTLSTTSDVHDSWKKVPVLPLKNKIDLSGQSVGLQGDTTEAGSFGFYAKDAKETYGLTAAHCVPRAQSGDKIVSPSALELTSRLDFIKDHTDVSLTPHRKSLQNAERKEEAMKLLGAMHRKESLGGCVILEDFQRKEVILSGPIFGEVIASQLDHKEDLLLLHNRQLVDQRKKDFTLPGGLRATQVDWALFKVSGDRVGQNLLSNDNIASVGLEEIGLLQPDQKVLKIGRTTALTRGIVNEVVIQSWGEMTINGKTKEGLTMEIAVVGDEGTTIFGDRGDSGSLVITDDHEEGKLLAVGVMIGATELCKMAIVTPIEPYLEEVRKKTRLNIEVCTVLEGA